MSRFIIDNLKKISWLKSTVSAVKLYLRNRKELPYFENVKERHLQAIDRIKKKDFVTVAFFVIHRSVWKYDLLFEMLEQHPRFKPVIIICPYLNHGEASKKEEMKLALSFFKTKKYNVKSTHLADNSWLDIKSSIDPDVIFFTNPHRLTKDIYYITNYSDCLTCYVPYSFHITHLHRAMVDQLFHNLLWKAFYETKHNKQYAIENARNKGSNVIITGYPGADIYIKNDKVEIDPWKPQDKIKKRIIWAPHHTILDNQNDLGFSTFLKYASIFVELAKKNKEQIQIAFKPHPVLKPKLYELPSWGQQRTDDYYNVWQEMDNGQLETGSYEDLFLTSDAMIHDCASFMAEYLYTKKPIMFLVRSKIVKNKFNSLGKLIFDQHYKAKNLQDVESFIKDVVIGDADELKQDRLDFVSSYLMQSEGLASENILNVLLEELA